MNAESKRRPAPPSLLPLALVALLASCGGDPEAPSGPAIAPPPAASSETPLFRDVTAESGLDFVHFNGMSGEYYYNEMVGPGAALADVDGDGDLDLYLVQGHMLGDQPISEATFPPRHPLPLSDRLYRNDLEAGQGGTPRPRFTDATQASGVARLTAVAEGELAYGMGVAAGDVDNDGRVDLYVTRLGPNQLLRNRGDGTFEDVTERSGAGDRRWSVSATFLDFDRDGWLDLYVANYVDFTLATHKRCRAATGAPDYCGPLSYRSEPDRLLRNRGDGTFEDVSSRAGIDREHGGALGVVAADLDLDGWIDIYVANDGTANQMWMSQGPGPDGRVTFENQALLGGSALNRDGQPEAGMGVDAGDVDGDGDEDLFLSHLTQETNTLYRNLGGARFEDATVAAGLASPSWDFTGFGTALLDFDRDGWLDVVVVNGAVKVIEELARANDPYPLHQPNQLYRNLGGGEPRFEEVTAAAAAAFAPSEVSRGAAVGDVDNDGDPDLVIANNAGPARLLVSEAGGGRHWLGLRLVGEGGRDMLGARVEIVRPGAPSLWRRVRSGGSYASANDPRVLAGLGESAAVEEVRVGWPSGRRERFRIDGVDRYHELREGTGEPLP